jgi:hypothetical protein
MADEHLCGIDFTGETDTPTVATAVNYHEISSVGKVVVIAMAA